MPQNIKEERLRWVLPIHNKEIKLIDIAKVCPHSQRSLERWLCAYRRHGEDGLIPRSTRPKSNPNETSIHVKERVVELRKETKLCALKLHWKLKKEGVDIHERTVGKIINTENLVRKYRVKKIKYKYIKIPLSPGELIEIDVKYVPSKLAGKQYFQYTAIDCATRWRYLKVYDQQSSYHSVEFLKEVMNIFPYRIRAVKTDNHSTFTNRYVGYLKSSDPMNPNLHTLDLLCQEKRIIHYLIDPGKPAQNGKVERSHRSDQQSFYSRVKFRNVFDLQRKIRTWNNEYNNLEHCGLNGKTPNEMLLLV